MIELTDIELKLVGAAGPVNILRGISLAIARGETVSLIGPSGSGKTSLLMIVAGLERQTGGTVRVAGTDLAALNEDQLAAFRRARIGIVFQSFHLIPTMTALENVAVPLEFAGRSDAFERARAELDAVGLGHRVGHYPAQLSGGEQQRVALARAFAISPSLLLADEPTGNLDIETGQQVIDLLFQRQQEHGSTLLLITHEHALASRCSRQLAMRDGKIVSDAEIAPNSALARDTRPAGHEVGMATVPPHGSTGSP